MIGSALRNGITAFLLLFSSQSSGQVPLFQVDPAWLKLPQNWVLGQGSAVAVDKHDNVWILHRPKYVGRLYEKPAA